MNISLFFLPKLILKNYYSRSSQFSRNPVILRTEFRTALKSLPLSILPFPVQTENAIIFLATRRLTITCGGTNSSSPPKNSGSSHCSHEFRCTPPGILTGAEFLSFISLAFFLFMDTLKFSLTPQSSSSTRNTTSDSSNSSAMATTSDQRESSLRSKGLTSLEAKRTFNAPRILPNHSSKSNETSSPHMRTLCNDKVNCSTSPDGMKFLKAQVHGPWDNNVAVNCSEVKLSATLESAACKPCILLHKDIDSDIENGKTALGSKTKILRSRYFIKDAEPKHGQRSKSDADTNNDFKLGNAVSNNAHDPRPGLSGSKKEKQVAFQSSYFQHKMRQNVNFDLEKVSEEYSVQTPMFDLGAGHCKTTDNVKHRPRSSYTKEMPLNENREDCESVELVITGAAGYSFRTPLNLGTGECAAADERKHRLRSPYFKEISTNENYENYKYEKLVVGGGTAVEPSNYVSPLSLPSNDSSECTRKRKLTQKESQRFHEDANDNDQISGMSTLNLEEETKCKGKFSCNISHLEQYSEIADKSLEKFASVMSSFRYKSSGARASGLRAPLKDVKNNLLKRPKLNMDLSSFLYTPPARGKTPSRCQKTKV